MSKIKSKDLQYDSTLPPFLQRLHEQHTGRGDSDRHERAIARPKRARNPDDEDDGPTVVDESGDVLSKDQVEKLTQGDGGQNAVETEKGSVEGFAQDAEAAAGASASVSKSESKVTNGQATKKRKTAKVVGSDDQKDSMAEAFAHESSTGQREAKRPTKTKRKAKAIKLAFGDEDEDG